MAKNQGDTKVINSRYGVVYFNGDKVATLTKASVKITLNYEDINEAGSLKTYRKLIGNEISGSLTLNKVDSKFSKIIADSVKNGYAPEINIQCMTNDKAFSGQEVLALYGVTLEELELFKVDGIFEQELPFKAVSFELLEEME